MKIVHYFKSNIMAGAERVVYDIVGALKKNKNYEVAVICGGNRVKEYFDELGVETYVHVNRNILAIKRIFTEIKPDVIHAHDNQASYLALLAGRGIPIISHIHNYYPYFETKDINYMINRIFRNRFRYNIYCSDTLKTKIVNQLPHLDNDKAIVLNNPIDVERIIEASSIEKKWPKADDKKIVGFIGRLVKQKGLIPFINLLSPYKNELIENNIMIIIVGEGPDKEKIMKLINNNKLKDMVQIIPYEKNPYPLIKSLALMILPSLWEGLPITILEAAVLKTPVLAMDVGGVSQFIHDNQTGYLCEKNNHKKFVEKMIYLLGQSHDKVVSRAFNSVKQEYGIVNYMEKLRQYYEASLLG